MYYLRKLFVPEDIWKFSKCRIHTGGSRWTSGVLRAEKQSNFRGQHLKPWQMRWTGKSGHPVARASSLGSAVIRNSSSGQDELAGKIRHCHQAWQPELHSQTHRWEERTNCHKLSSDLYTVACVCVFVYVQCMCVPMCTWAHICTYTYTRPCVNTQIDV